MSSRKLPPPSPQIEFWNKTLNTNFDIYKEKRKAVESQSKHNFVCKTATCFGYIRIQGVSGGIVNILGGGSMDYSE